MSSVLEEVEDVPQKWIDLQLEKLVNEGWRPRIKRRGDKEYLTIRLGNQERGLGEATEENIALFGKLFPNIRGMLSNPRFRPTPGASSAEKGEKILSTKVARPTPLSPTVHLSLKTLQWYTYTKETLGYPGTLDDFLNNIVDEYFGKYQKMSIGIIIGEN